MFGRYCRSPSTRHKPDNFLIFVSVTIIPGAVGRSYSYYLMFPLLARAGTAASNKPVMLRDSATSCGGRD